MPQESLFGRVLTAMVTPMFSDGSLDLVGAARLAEHLVDNGHDGLVVNGTTGESPTTTDSEKVDLVRAVVEAVGHRARVIAGAGSNNTAHTIECARAAEKAGAHGLLIVTPYYNKPPQEGILAHFTTVADATDLPVIVYDIPGRTGTPIHTETLLRMAAHPRIVAVKDAKGDLFAASEVMSRSDLLWYSGDDALNLAHLTQGAVGIVSVVGHLASRQYAEMIAAVGQGNLARAIEIHRQLIPVVNAVMHITQGPIMVKAALHDQGIIASDALRLPLISATKDQLARVREGIERSKLS
ncbi:MAG: 4-hydroxy-tetrahydrodipicolinate synthase [Actinomycetota bacterium]